MDGNIDIASWFWCGAATRVATIITIFSFLINDWNCLLILNFKRT